MADDSSWGSSHSLLESIEESYDNTFQDWSSHSAAFDSNNLADPEYDEDDDHDGLNVWRQQQEAALFARRAVNTFDANWAQLEAMTELLLALDPPRHGFVLERDFRLVLGLAGWSGETRLQERAVDTLVKHYRVAPSSSSGNGLEREYGQREQRKRQRAVPVAPEATAAANVAASTYGDTDLGFPSNCLTWPINYERFLIDLRVMRLEGLEDCMVPPAKVWIDQQKKRARQPTALQLATVQPKADALPPSLSSNRSDTRKGSDAMANTAPAQGNQRDRLASSTSRVSTTTGPASSPAAARVTRAISTATTRSSTTITAPASAIVRAAPKPANDDSNKSIDRSWQGHAAAFVRRRVAAAGWLMRTGCASKRVLVTRDVATRTLEQTAVRARGLVGLRAIAVLAKEQISRHRVQKRWLIKRLVRAQKHATRRAGAYWNLCAMARRGVKLSLAMGSDQTNANKCYQRRYATNQAFKWLAAVGALQIKRTNQRLEAVHWLEALGKKAALRWPIRVAIFTDNLKPLGKKAIVRRRDREDMLGRLFKMAKRAGKRLPKFTVAADFLRGRGAQALTCYVPKASAKAWLEAVGQGVCEMVFRSAMAAKFLKQQGEQSARHVVKQAQARDFLAKRLQDAKNIKKMQKDNVAWLTSCAQNAYDREEGDLRNARVWLLQRLLYLRQGHVKQRRLALQDLKEAIGDARLKKRLQEVTKRYPRRWQELCAEVATEDGAKARKRRNLSSEQLLEAEARDLFDVYDIDKSGELDRLEFRALCLSGALSAYFSPNELDDVFRVMDMDSSGAVDFTEFFKWFRHQVNQRPTAKLPTCASLVTVPVRASRRLLVELNQSGEAAENIKELQLESAQAQAELERKELEEKKEEERTELERIEKERGELERKEAVMKEDESEEAEVTLSPLDDEAAAAPNDSADGATATVSPTDGTPYVTAASQAVDAGMDSLEDYDGSTAAAAMYTSVQVGDGPLVDGDACAAPSSSTSGSGAVVSEERAEQNETR